VGVNHAVDPELPQLRYADDDAARYGELFRALGARVYLLTRPDENTRRISPEAVRGARDPRRAELAGAVAALAGDVAAARARGQRALFYFVYAGHGNVSGTTAYLALEDARLDGDEIEREIVDKVHADESHLIIDACYSYFLAYGRGPGGKRHDVRQFAATEGLAHRPDIGLLLSTTSARESHEWADFEAGIFSHEVRSGMYGAADRDGDGQISYLEIAAFVSRANAAVPNERFRPEVFARAPSAGAAQLVDLRQATGRRLRVAATVQAGHYLFEDSLGVRFADFHNARGRELSVLVPASPHELYLRRVSDDLEFAIPAGSEAVSLAELAPRPPRQARRGGGASEYAFNLLFSLPFDDEAVTAYARRPPPVDLDAAADLEAPLPRWRRVTGYSALAVAGLSTALAVGLAISARSLSGEARGASWQVDTVALNQRLAERRRWTGISLAVAGGAAIAGGFALLWPRSPVQPTWMVSGSSGTMGLAGGF
jgi:hypothetical protein